MKVVIIIMFMIEVRDISWIQKEEIIKCQQQNLYPNNILSSKKFISMLPELSQ